jgi:hypothetical protein
MERPQFSLQWVVDPPANQHIFNIERKRNKTVSRLVQYAPSPRQLQSRKAGRISLLPRPFILLVAYVQVTRGAIRTRTPLASRE